MKQLLAILSLLCILPLQAQPQADNSRMNGFIDDLMGKMTLEEKLGQLNLPTYTESGITTGTAISRDVQEKIRKGHVGAIFNVKGVDKAIQIQKIAVEESRLKIPLFFGLDVIHGYKTIFPIPLALSSTWNMETIEKVAEISAKEASADGINWTFSPMVDISRDARWGRVAEGAGEDPFLGGKVAQAMVKGYQGDNTYASNDRILSCVKHFALYGAPDAGRDYNTVDMSRQRMFNEYMYPYQAAIDAGAASVMTAFNEVDGVPATANKWLLTDVLRKQWGFDGFVVSDYTSLSEMSDHGIGDLPEVSIRAMNAGLDMEMVSEGFFTTLPEALEENRVSLEKINQACRRILEAKYKLGLFDDPYKYLNPERAKKDIFSEEHLHAARKIASESFVLLKNQENLLPLKKEGTIAIVGPLANNRTNMVGTWSVAADYYASQTVLEGIKEVAGKNAKVLYAKGSNLVRDERYEKRGTADGYTIERDNRSDKEMLDEALSIARKSDVVLAVLGEAAKMNGEGNCRTDITIPDVQRELLEALVQTGKPVVLILFTGRPLALTWENEHVPAILNVWFGGTMTAPAIGDVIFGDVNPGGKLTMSFPQNVGQVPLYYNHKNTGRPGKSRFDVYKSTYIDVENAPLYPFGYGLSYAKFEYTGLVTNTGKTAGEDARVKVSVNVKNTGSCDGSEVVQLYIRDVVGSITRPVKELKAFEKVSIKAGESRTVNFDITTDLLKFYNYDLVYDWEPGAFEIMVGGNSRDVLKTDIYWEK